MKIEGLGTFSVEEAKAMMGIAKELECEQKVSDETYEVELEMEGVTIRTDAQHVETILKALQKASI